jgi:hypothetical protein
MCQSVPHLLAQYDAILGLSGSLGSPAERDFLRAVFGATFAETPSFLDTCRDAMKHAPTLVDDAVVVHTSDHGDMMGDHGLMLKGGMHFLGCLRVPMVIHTRSASDDTLNILKEEGEIGDSGSAGGVFHCFTETQAVAKGALDLGYYISFSGILTFKTAKELRDVAAWVPLDRLLIETDSPYLAPVPYRGKTNNPSYVPFVAKLLAELRGMTPEAVGQLTSENFNRLFPKVSES